MHVFEDQVLATVARHPVEAFVASVRSRKPPVCRVEHGRDAVLACLLVREALDAKRVATMKELLA